LRTVAILTIILLALVSGGCGKSPNESDLRGLIKKLADPDWRVQKEAANSIGKFGPTAKAAVPELAKLLKDKIHYLPRMRAANLIEALTDESEAVKGATAWALMKITGEQFGLEQARWCNWWERNK